MDVGRRDVIERASLTHLCPVPIRDKLGRERACGKVATEFLTVPLPSCAVYGPIRVGVCDFHAPDVRSAVRRGVAVRLIARVSR